MAGQPLILKNWHVGLELSKEAQSTIPIWVNIYNIPLEYWNPEGLGYIASVIGKPLYVHNMTASCRRISFARLCIEVSAEFDLIKEFDIEYIDPSSGEQTLISLKVEYQWSPIRCAKCKKFGHNCAKLPKVPNLQQSASRPPTPSKNGPEEGVWMVITKGKNVVDQGQVCSSSTSVHIETNQDPVNITEMNQQPQSSNGTVRLEVKPPEVISVQVEQHNVDEDTSLSLLPPISLEKQIDYSHGLDQGILDPNCSMVTKIDGVQSYAMRPEGYELQKQNQFAMLEEVTPGQDEVEEIAASALSMQSTEDINHLNHANPANNTGHSSTHGTSGQTNKKKTKQGSSSGKKRHPFRRT